MDEFLFVKGYIMKKTNNIAILVMTMVTIGLCPNLLAVEKAKVTNLRCEYLNNPLGIEEIHPRLSWRLQSEQRGQKSRRRQVPAYGKWPGRLQHWLRQLQFYV